MAPKFSNETILEQLKHGVAHFELVSSPVLSISTSIYSPANPVVFLGDYSHRFFARLPIGRGSESYSVQKVESYLVQEVFGDGRCLFRALIKGMAANDGKTLSLTEERKDADDLRRKVKDFICSEHEKQNPQYEVARKAIQTSKYFRSFDSYCENVTNPNHWGGKPELLALSEYIGLPIIVYKRVNKNIFGGGGSGFIRIEEYGTEFSGKNKAVRLLLKSGSNHYDLLV